MSLLMTLLVAAVSMLIIASIVLAIIESISKRRNVRGQGVSIIGTVIDVQAKQDWRDEEKWERDAWTAEIKRRKTWQTCYDITAQWAHPSTERAYTIGTRIWANDSTKKPAKGDAVTIWLDRHNPEHSCLDLQPSPDSLPTEEHAEMIISNISHLLNV